MGVYLHELPPDHPERNQPLEGAFYGPKGTALKRTGWKQVLPSYKLAKRTYNDLGPAFTQYDWWTFEERNKS